MYFGFVDIRTQDCWARCINATSMLCHRPGKIWLDHLSFCSLQRFRRPVQLLSRPEGIRRSRNCRTCEMRTPGKAAFAFYTSDFCCLTGVDWFPFPYVKQNYTEIKDLAFVQKLLFLEGANWLGKVSRSTLYSSPVFIDSCAFLMNGKIDQRSLDPFLDVCAHRLHV